MPPQAVRPLALIAVLGGAVLVVLGFVQLASPEQADPYSRTSDYLIEALRALALLLTLAGFVALHLLQTRGYGGPRGWTGFLRRSSGRAPCSPPWSPPSPRARRPWASSSFWEPSSCSWRSRFSRSRPTR